MRQLNKLKNRTFTQSNTNLQRCYDIDWLRVLAVLLLVYFHTAMIFGDFDWYVHNDVFSRGLTLFVYFVHQWHMPLLFLLSGAATCFALNYRSWQQYLKERLKRLLIPFVFGIFALVPPQIFFNHLFCQLNFSQSYLQFYPTFFRGDVFQPAHLWFLEYLIVYCLISLPLFLSLKNNIYLRDRLSRFASLCDPKAGIFGFALPLVFIDIALRGKFDNFVGGLANFTFYLIYFIYGYLIFSAPRFRVAIAKQGNMALTLGTISSSIYLTWFLPIKTPVNDYSLGYVFYQSLHGFNSWCWVIVWLSLGQRYLNFSNRVLRYCGEIAYPFYIVHQTIIVAIAFYLVRLNFGVVGKFLFISTSSLLLSIAICEYAIKRTNLTRFLFGMKLKSTSRTV